MPESLHPLESALATAWPSRLWGDTRQLVAVSGGADSVALLLALLRLAPQPGWIDVAHFNHCWRGAASEADEAFVRELCQAHQVRFFLGRADQEIVATGGQQTAAKSEASARLARYRFLTQTAYACGARYVLTAHTASDRVETMLHNLFRGTGLAGVAAPSLTRPLDHELMLARPLIGCTREQVEGYLRDRQQSYCEDASNVDLSFARNRVRHQLLPQLREAYGPQVDARLLSFSQLAEEAVETLRSLAVDYLREVETLTPPQACSGCIQAADFCFPSRSVLATPWAVVQQALCLEWHKRNWPLQPMSREHWEAIRQQHAQDLPLPAVNLPSGLQLQSRAGWLIVKAPASE